MIILYNGTDITTSIQPTVAQIIDNSGGKPDSLNLVFADPDGLWSRWRPAKGDTLQVKESGFDTGVLYIDQITQQAGYFGLMALSIPQISKTARSQGWENVRLMEMVTQIAARYGFGVQTYGLINHLYERVDQREEPDFSFLDNRCRLEGYALKINNNNLIIYDEALQESKAPEQAARILPSDIIGSFTFTDKSTDIFGKCIIRSQAPNGYLEGTFQTSDLNGPTLKLNVYATNQAEANRWARGTLRNSNKLMVTGGMAVKLNAGFAAGTTVKVEQTGMFDGPFFVHRLVHDLIQDKSILTLRRPLEGY